MRLWAAGRAIRRRPGRAPCIWAVIMVPLILWLLGFAVVNVGSLIHLLLVIALAVLIYQLVTGRCAL